MYITLLKLTKHCAMKKFFLLIPLCLMLASCNQSGSKNKVKILAHRGLCSSGTEFVTDENTLDALRRAQEAGVDGCEFDVHMTADGQLVIRHDAKIEGKLNCQKSTFDEIRAYRLPFGNQIPTLHEWLEQAKKTPEIPQMLEIKAHPTAEIEKEVVTKCLEEVRAMDMMDQVYFLSFKTETCDEVLRQEPGAKVLLNSSSLHNSMPPKEVKEHGYAAISYNINVILNHTPWIKEFQDLGIETFFWMVDDPYLRKIAEEWGFDWVTTDFYDVIKY